MVDRLASLDFLLELVQSERDKQLAHFEALDNKAGIVLAFSGLLITLAPDVPMVFRVLGSLQRSSVRRCRCPLSGLAGSLSWSRARFVVTSERRKASRA